MKEEFDKLAASGKIRAADVDTLVQLATEGFCMHKSNNEYGIQLVEIKETAYLRSFLLCEEFFVMERIIDQQMMENPVSQKAGYLSGRQS